MKVMNHLVAATVLLATASSFANPSRRLESKIVGGVEASIGEFPFIVSLQSPSYGHFCGGSLIQKNWVLTAAHCVRGTTNFKIVVGLHDQKDARNAETIAVKRVISHPQYDSRSMDYDFALVELAQEASFSPVGVNVSEIAIPNDQSQAMISTTAGWGATREGSYTLPNLLQKVDVPLVSAADCNKSYSGKITDRMICAGYAGGGKDSCQGDSGGPLVTRDENGAHVLIGVVSWGQGCARPNYYGVYAKVNSVQSWIGQYVQ